MTIVPDAKRMSKRTPGTDDRRTCAECLRLSGGVCTAAAPQGMVIAQRGWRPSERWLTVPHRCSAFAASKTPAKGTQSTQAGRS